MNAVFNKTGEFFTLEQDGHEVHVSATDDIIQIGDSLTSFTFDQICAVVDAFPTLAELVAQQRL